MSGFVGGDVVAIPKGSPNEAIGREFVTWVLSDEAQLEGLAKNAILTTRTDLADNEYFAGNEKVQATAAALEAGYVPWVFHFADMVNSDSSPWINMLQQAIFDGDVDGAIEDARARMLRDRRPVGRRATARRPRPAGRAAQPGAVDGCLPPTTGCVGLPLPRRRRCSSWRSSSSIRCRSSSTISMTSESLLGGGEFVWFDNYLTALNDRNFWRAFWFTRPLHALSSRRS